MHVQVAAASAEQRAQQERALRLATLESALDERTSEAEELHARAQRDSSQAAHLLGQHQAHLQLSWTLTG